MRPASPPHPARALARAADAMSAAVAALSAKLTKHSNLKMMCVLGRLPRGVECHGLIIPLLIPLGYRLNLVPINP